jgi:hypothetical protein
VRQRKRIRERLQLEHSTLDNSRLRLDRATTPVKMKLNISYPANGSQKLIEIDDERKLRAFMEKRMGTEVPGDGLGDEFKGYVCLPFFVNFFTFQSIGIAGDFEITASLGLGIGREHALRWKCRMGFDTAIKISAHGEKGNRITRMRNTACL